MNASQDNPPIVEIGEANFQTEVLGSKQPVLVVFRASWSHPCQILDAVLEEVAKVCAGKARVAKVSADDNPDLSLWYDVQSIPTLLYFVNGSLRARIIGTASKEVILSKLQAVFQGGGSPSHTLDRDKDNEEHLPQPNIGLVSGVTLL
jgi:thioredoxin 1